MLIPEACQLVLEAAMIGADGDVMVLEMGEQVQIQQLARTLIRLSGRTDVDIVYTGLRPGEKLGEALFSDTEERSATPNNLVTRVGVPPLSRDEVRDLLLTTHLSAAAYMRHQALPAHAVALAVSTPHSRDRGPSDAGERGPARSGAGVALASSDG